MNQAGPTLAAMLPVALALALTAMAAAAQVQPDIEDLLTRVGERVSAFYDRANTVMCIESSTVQDIDYNHSPIGFARTVESELRIEASTSIAGEATVMRTILKVNGRVPRESDKKNRAGCTDPTPLSSDPLAFLLPAQRSNYRFKQAGMGRDRDRAAVMIDFASVNRRSKAELIQDPGGHDDCFDWTGHIASQGRIWLDAANHDVLRVERRLGGPVDVTVPPFIQQRHRLPNWVAIVRDDVTIRYRSVEFNDPDELLLLPESIDSFTVVRGGLQSTRRHQRFSNYRRFVTGGRLVD